MKASNSANNSYRSQPGVAYSKVNHTTAPSTKTAVSSKNPKKSILGKKGPSSNNNVRISDGKRNSFSNSAERKRETHSS